MKKLIFTAITLCSLAFLFSCDLRDEDNITVSRIKIDSVKIPQQTMDLLLHKPLKLILPMLPVVIDFMIMIIEQIISIGS